MRRLTRFQFACFFLCGTVAAPWPLAAQQGKARVVSDDAPRQGARPEAEPLRVQAVPPQLQAVLEQWYAKTQGIKKLQGEHRRWTYETTFAVAKVSAGRFYFEAPDKGRIDLEPEDEAKHQDLDPATPGVQIRDQGQNVYTLKPDEPQKWVCDGERIIRIDDAAKTYELISIPPDQQGVNVMDGPLPFLFGLPPEKAKQRYNIALAASPDPQNYIALAVKPRLPKDAANWQHADVLLWKDTFLPVGVRLLDPSGNGTTVFSFGRPEVNPSKILQFFTGDPFKPVLLTYKQVQSSEPAPIQPLNVQGKPLKGMPSLIGLKHADAQKVLGARGFRTLNVQPGPKTDDPKLRHCVAEQSPAPGADAKPGEKVTLMLYVTDEDLQRLRNAPPRKDASAQP